MDEIDRYIREVLRNTPFPIAERERIEADLRGASRIRSGGG